MRTEYYRITDVFSVKNIFVLVLDKPFRSYAYKSVELEGKPVNIYFDMHDAPKAVTMHEKVDGLVGKKLAFIY